MCVFQETVYAESGVWLKLVHVLAETVSARCEAENAADDALLHAAILACGHLARANQRLQVCLY